MIWLYRDQGLMPSEAIVRAQTCLFCQSPLSLLHTLDRMEKREERYLQDVVVRACDWSGDIKVCAHCGWWRIQEEYACRSSSPFDEWFADLRGAYAHIRNFDTVNIRRPIEAAQHALQSVHMQQHALRLGSYEQVIERVFADAGYVIRAVGHACDAQRLVIVVQSNRSLIGIQAYIEHADIHLEQLQAITGVLVAGNQLRGIFVLPSYSKQSTTMQFQRREPQHMAGLDAAMARGEAIELLDPVAFLTALGVGAQQPYASCADWQKVVGEVDLEWLGMLCENADG